MYIPAPDDKLVTVMAYTAYGLVRGELVAKENVRVNIWLRTDSAPKYWLFIKPHVVMLAAGTVKTVFYPELYLPVSMVLAYHLVPPQNEPLDYDEGEANRKMQPVAALLGSFVFKGQARVSMQTEFGTTIEVARTNWMSLYNVEVSNPYLPQLKVMAPMLLVNPDQVGFVEMG